MRLPLGDGTPWNALSNGAPSDPGSIYTRVLYDGTTQSFGRDVQKYLTVLGQFLFVTDGSPTVEIYRNGELLLFANPPYEADIPPAIATVLHRFPVSNTDVVTAVSSTSADPAPILLLTSYLEYDIQTDVARSVVPFTPGQLSTPFACPVFVMTGLGNVHTIHTGTAGLQENITLHVTSTTFCNMVVHFQSADNTTTQRLLLNNAAPFDFVVLDDIPMVGVTIAAEGNAGSVIYGHVTR